VFNLFLGFILPDVDNMAHIGGLLTGLVFGLLFVPSRVPAMRSLWVRPGPTPGTTVPLFGASGTIAIRVAGLLLVAAGFAFLWTIGEGVWG
jgi:membrane associated rhomboid family serine protease